MFSNRWFVIFSSLGTVAALTLNTDQEPATSDLMKSVANFKVRAGLRWNNLPACAQHRELVEETQAGT